MKRLQISLEPELDVALGQEADREGVSKAEVVRRCLRQLVGGLPPIEEDPLFAMFGTVAGDPGDSRSIDDTVYGPSESHE